MAPPAAIEVYGESDTNGITIPNPLLAPIRSNEILGRRRKVDASQWGTAAPCDTATFRLKSYEGKPKSKRWDDLLTEEARTRKGNSLKNAAKYLAKPGLITLGGGIPSSEHFPFEELSVKVPSLGHFSEEDTRKTGVTLTAGKHDLANGKSIYDISTAFNYGQGAGAAQLLRWVTEHTELVHDIKYEDWACTLNVGSTSGFEAALRMFTRPGDMILSEVYTFSAAVDCATPLGIRVAGIPMDGEGPLPEPMDDILSNWNVESRGARKPKIFYTVPTGQNPTGCTQSLARRKALYDVCQKHDVYIIEDEPYYFLQMQPYTGPNSRDVPPPKSHEEFLHSIVPSYLSLDTEGRVMRLDSFSKVISPGSRIGWVTGSKQIISAYAKASDLSTQNPSGMSQLILFKLLDEHWGHAGYLDWLIHIRMSYTRRRDAILAACEAHLPRDIVSWDPPMAGMFHWLRVDFRKHPDYPAASIERIQDKIFMGNIDEGVLLMPGSYFYANAEEEHDALFFRATYAAAPAEKIEEAIRRFGASIRKEFRL